MRSFRKSLLLLSILAFIMVSLLMSSCKCKHEYGEYQVTENATCSSVGVKEAICNLCGEKEFVEIPKDITAHAYGEWIVDSEPNCILAGAKHRVCSLCNDIDAQAMAENENYHTFLNAWQTIIEPTCSKDGKQERECACGYKESAILPKLTEGGHTYGEWAISIEPTCSSEGQRIRYCLDCEKPQAEKLTALDEGGHSYGEWYTVTEPNCSETGTKMRDCAYCESKEESEIPVLTSGGHDFGAWQTTKEPTCSTEGEQKRACSRCNVVEYDTLSVLTEGGHSFGTWYETIKATCDTEGEKRRDCSLCESYFETDVIEKLPIVYTLTIDIDGKKTIVNLPKDGIYALSEPTKLGYTFLGYFEGDKQFNLSGIVTESKALTAKFELAPTTTFNELKTRIDGGVDKILLGDNIILTDTIYVSGDVTLVSNGNYTLTRDASFLGELFVIGEDKYGSNTILKGEFAKLTIKPEENATITIDGNKANLTDIVTGTVFFMTNGCTLNIYDGVVIQNHKKLGNEKIYVDKYAFDENELIGGSVALINDGTFNMYGGLIQNNEVNPYYSGFVNDEDKVDGYKNGSYGGVIYNIGVVNMYGGTIKNNLASYGGVFYNARELNIQGGTIENNIATAYGGVVFSANTGSAITYLGSSVGDITENKIFIKNNQAKGGGAIYLLYSASTVIYGNTVFECNNAEVAFNDSSVGLNGGAICTYGELIIYHAEFKNNNARYYGGAIYSAYSAEDKVPRVTSIKSASFDGNTAKGGGAIMVSNTKVTLDTVVANGNIATSKGGGFAYLSGSELSISGGEIKGSICNDAHGGAFYLTGSKLNLTGSADKRILVSDNTTVGNGGVICAYVQTEEIVTGTDAEGNDIIETKSTRSTINLSYVDLKSNTSTTKSPYGGGAIYASNSDVVADNTIFELNSAIYGGAISLFSSATFTGDIISFINNIADENGGVMYTSKSTVELTNVTVSDNCAKGYTETVDVIDETTGEPTGETTEKVVVGKGGAFYINSTSTFKGTNITATGNSAGNGGFMYGAYSVITFDGECSFVNNEATSTASQAGGGAMYLSDCTGSIKNASFNQNTASNGGALAIFKCKDDVFVIEGCTFSKNTVTKTGGTFYLNTSTIKITGCTVEESNGKDNGGVIYSTTCTVDISNSTFENNNGTDGLIYLTKSTFTSTNDKYLNNTSKYGVYHVNSTSTLNINNGTMNGNTANFGSCIYVPNGTLVVNGLSATGNISTKGNGGVINVTAKEGVTTVATINNAAFTENKATYDNADCYGGAISVGGGATLTINNSVFTNNQAAKGGAIALTNGTLTVNGITASGNRANGYTDGTSKKGGHGGAIYVGAGTFTLNEGTEITANTFTTNSALSAGGAIYCFDTETVFTIASATFIENEAETNYGGALYIRGASITVDIGNIIAEGNKADKGNGGAIYFYAFKNGTVDSIVANNNTASNGGAIYIAGSTTVDIYELSGTGNSASANGGFAYIGTSTTKIHSGTVGENDDKNGREFYFSVKVSINTEKFTYPDGGINDASKITAITE